MGAPSPIGGNRLQGGERGGRVIPFGKYLLLERLAVGGMAEVYMAKSFGVEGFEKLLAIKRILPTMAEDDDFIEMFVDEAQIAGQLSHASIVPIYELGKIGESHYIAMEFVWGKDLLQIMNRFRRLRKRMPPAMVAWVACKMCEALDYAHKKKDRKGNDLNIIHRDISPQNILISYEGEVKLIDFGIAKAASRTTHTQAGVLKGKFGYMSPEQVKGMPVDHRSDIFAVGTCMYEMITSERLFLGESDFSTLDRVRNADVPSPATVVKDLPPELERIIMKALAGDLTVRYESAAELRDHLQQFLSEQRPPFGTSKLAAWLKTAFAADMAKEKEKLDGFAHIGRPSVQGRSPIDAAIRPSRPDDQRPTNPDPPQSTGAAAMPGPPRAHPVPPPPPPPASPLGGLRSPAPQVGSGVPSAPPAPAAAARAAIAAAPAARPAQMAPSSVPVGGAGDELNDGPTMITQSPFDLVQAAMEARGKDDAAPLTLEGGAILDYDNEISELADAPTQIFFTAEEGEDEGAPTPQNSFPTMGEFSSPGADQAVPMAAAPTPAPAWTVGSEAPRRTATPTAQRRVATMEIRSTAWSRLVTRLPLPLPILLGLALGGLLVGGLLIFGLWLAVGARSTAELRVRTVPAAGATVLVDGRTVGTAPLRLGELEEGEYRLEVRAEGFLPSGRAVRVSAGQTAIIEFALVPAPTEPAAPATTANGPTNAAAAGETTETEPGAAAGDAPAANQGPPEAQPATGDGEGATAEADSPSSAAREPAQGDGSASGARPRNHAASSGTSSARGTLVINTMPWARVFIDGRDTGRNTPVQGLRVRAGSRHIGLRTPDGEMHSVEVEVPAGETVRVVRRL